MQRRGVHKRILEYKRLVSIRDVRIRLLSLSSRPSDFTTFAGRKNLIELKLIDGVPTNITVGMPFLFG